VHGDGILVNVNSPEAFEEIIWKEFWPSYYKREWIIPWSEKRYPDFEDFFIDHMQKIIHLRSNVEKQARYISKNNQNIARIGYLNRVFPDAIIILLFRSPIQHAASLLKQHRNFLSIHQDDVFAQKYMADTGHFDFGDNLRPVDFNGWFSKQADRDLNSLSFWLQYWVNTYSYLFGKSNDQVRFLSFDSLCDQPQRSLERLGSLIEVKNIETLMKSVYRISTPKPHLVDNNEIDPEILNQVEDIYLKLLKAEDL
jgi:hypothetical protein